jgi:hypothetical protein
MLFFLGNIGYANGNQYYITRTSPLLLRIRNHPDLFADHSSMFFEMKSICFAVAATSVYTLHNEGKRNYWLLTLYNIDGFHFVCHSK